MQVAYREKVDYIASIRPELDAQQDETEGAEIKATLLKKQLEDMSRRVEEQEKTMMEMARELAEEKIKSHDSQKALEAARTIRVVPSAKDELRHESIRPRRRDSNSNASDSGFESDMESIFSSQSVPGTPLSAPDISLMPTLELRMENVRQANERESMQVKKKPSALTGNGQRLGREGAAWATVDVLRTENRELKSQIQQMEETLQGCIDLIGAVGTA